MSDSGDFTIDCATCIGHGTTACNDCVVTHLLANDDGPIDLVTAPEAFPAPEPTPDELALVLLERAGLLDDPPVFVSMEEFLAGSRRPTGHLTVVR